jgi:hypothetical protein
LPLPDLKIEIDAKAFRKIKQKRSQALARGLLVSEKDDFVAAKITFDEQEYAAEIRLKGDWLDHLKGAKWSWRVKLGDDQAIWATRQFSLQHPKTRFYLHEWVYHQLLEKEGLLSPQYRFVELWLNGDYKGIYAFEEHFTADLLAAQQQPDGLIFKYNEDGFWQTQDFRMRYGKNVTPNLPDFEASDIEAFQEKRTLSDSLIAAAFLAGRTRMEELRSTEKDTLGLQYLDIDYWAKFLALTDLCEAYHALRWHNMRFYYHPHTSQLYPIGFDGYGESGIYRWFKKPFLGYYQPEKAKVYFAEEYFLYKLFRNAEFRVRYGHYLSQYSTPAYQQEIRQALAKKLGFLSPILQKEFPDYAYNLDQLGKRAEDLQQLLATYDFVAESDFEYTIYDPIYEDCATSVPLAAIGLKAYRAENGDILVQNYFCKAITLEATGPKRSKPLHSLHRPLRLPPFDIHSPLPSFLSIKCLPEDQYVFYSVAGVDYWFKQKITPWPATPTVFINKQELQMDTNVFVRQGNSIKAKQGIHQLRSVQVIPEQYQLNIGPDAQLDLLQGAALLVYGPASFLGTAKSPIKVTSSDQTGRGIHFFQEHPVQIAHLQFRDQTTYQDHGLLLNGALSFDGSSLQLTHSSFSNIDAEDAVNISQCQDVQLENLVFENTTGDGLDIDFSNGSIRNLHFSNLGGDAVDVSGSNFVIEDVSIENVVDKGMSIGEAATITATNLTIKHAFTAIAVKDGSAATLDAINIDDAEYGLAVFTKKSTYGHARLAVHNVKFTAIRTLNFVLESTHELSIDDTIRTFTHLPQQLLPVFYPPEE